MPKLLNLLGNDKFRRFFITNTTAYIGINIGLIGMSWFIIDYTSQNRILAIYMAINLLSTFIASFFIGTLIDLHNKSSIMRWCNACQGVLLLGLLFLFLINTNILIVIYSLAVVNSIALAIYSTASRCIIQEMLEKEDLIFGNSVIEISLQIGAIVAACVTGFLYSYYGFTIVIILMVVSLFISAIFMKKIECDLSCNSECKEKYSEQILNGMKYLIKNKTILLYGIAVFIPFIVTIMSNSVLPGYVKEHLMKGSIIFGTADMLFGIGALAAGILISSMIKIIKKESLQVYMFILSICSLAFLVVNKSVIALYIAYFIFGLANSSLKVILNTYLMEIVPKNLYGRALSFLSAISSVLQAIMVFAMGYLMDSTAVTYGYLTLSIIMVVGFISINLITNKIDSQEQLVQEVV